MSNVENNNTDKNDNYNSFSDLKEKEYTGSKQNIKIATIGHVDHGKSTLTSAITKFYGKYIPVENINFASEINKNGIKYSASFVEYETDNRHYSHYDLSGHEDYIKSIVSGSIKLDGAILVVAATDGPMAQTREQLMLMQQSGVSRIVVYMSKCDMIDDVELLDLVEIEIRELISEYGFDGDNTPIIRGSALKALDGDAKEEKNIRKLVLSLDKWITKNTITEIASYHTEFNANIYVLSKEEGGRHTPFFNDYKPQFSISSTKQYGSISLPDGVEMVMPGDNVEVIINLEKEALYKRGDYFQIYEDDKLVGLGLITEIIK